MQCTGSRYGQRVLDQGPHDEEPPRKGVAKLCGGDPISTRTRICSETGMERGRDHPLLPMILTSLR